MQVVNSEARLSSPPQILPTGEDTSRGRGRRQFYLKHLLLLITVAATVLSVGRCTDLSPATMFGLVVLWLVVWWQYAEIREDPCPSHPDQQPLRDEVRQWQTDLTDPQR